MTKNKSALGFFERFLSIWISLAICAGILLGNLFPESVQKISALEYAHVNLPIAVLIWFMIYPMMLQIDFRSLKNVGKEPKGLFLTLVINWAIKPFTMALLAWLFFKFLFVNWVNAQNADEYIAGMILLGVAPCTAMVFVWSQLTNGNPNYTLAQVAINDLIMIFLFAPIAGLLLGVSDIDVPWNTLFVSVVLYVVIPLLAGYYSRKFLQHKGNSLNSFIKRTKPFSIIGLIATVVLLFAFQANTIISQPVVIILIAIPLLLQSYGIFALGYFSAKKLQLDFSVAAPAAMIGTSNFFELAVAVAISLFGLQSGAALATVVGVLVEVPVMLSLVSFANKTKGWFEYDK